MKKTKKFLEPLFFLFLVLSSVLLAMDRRYSACVKDGLTLWLTCVLPSLFPYFFITALLSTLKTTTKISKFVSPLTKKLFNVNGYVGYAFFLSLISGYPLGAKTISELKESNLISSTESERGSALCSTSSPMFLIGSVGNLMFKSAKFGLLLFTAHVLSAIIIGLIFSFYKKSQPCATAQKSIPLKSADNVLYESAYSSVISVLIVGALITIFYLLTEILINLKILSPLINLLSLITKNPALSKSVVLGGFECTRGLKLLSEQGFSSITLPIASAICSFGGLSVIAQSTTYLKKAKIKTAPFLISKILSAVISFFIAFLLSFLL